MRIVLLGTGTPRYDLQRSGPSQVLDTGQKKILVDCGPLTTYKLFRSDIALGDIDTLFFTHHHHDHNADFPIFLVASWYHGRKNLKIFGPSGTQAFVSKILDIYRQDFATRQNVFHRGGLIDLEIMELQPRHTYKMEWGEVSTLNTIHEPPNLAYRFTASGKTVVFTGDTAYCEDLKEFSKGANALVHEAHIAKPLGSAELTTEEITPNNIYAASNNPYEKGVLEIFKTIHSTPEEAAMIARVAGVKKLILNHISPFRDTDDMRMRATKEFRGQVIIGEDLMTIPVD